MLMVPVEPLHVCVDWTEENVVSPKDSDAAPYWTAVAPAKSGSSRRYDGTATRGAIVLPTLMQ